MIRRSGPRQSTPSEPPLSRSAAGPPNRRNGAMSMAPSLALTPATRIRERDRRRPWLHGHRRALAPLASAPVSATSRAEPVRTPAKSSSRGSGALLVAASRARDEACKSRRCMGNVAAARRRAGGSTISVSDSDPVIGVGWQLPDCITRTCSLPGLLVCRLGRRRRLTSPGRDAFQANEPHPAREHDSGIIVQSRRCCRRPSVSVGCVRRHASSAQRSVGRHGGIRRMDPQGSDSERRDSSQRVWGRLGFHRQGHQRWKARISRRRDPR